jgi:hypothetical protein
VRGAREWAAAVGGEPVAGSGSAGGFRVAVRPVLAGTGGPVSDPVDGPARNDRRGNGEVDMEESA